MKHKRVMPGGVGVVYDTLREAIQGYIDELDYGGAEGDDAITFHSPICEITEDGLFDHDKCTCLPIRFRLDDMARIGSARAAGILHAAGYSPGKNVQDTHYQRDEES